MPLLRALERGNWSDLPQNGCGDVCPDRMVDITKVDSTPEIAAAVVFTPTFIITDGDREITRMEGYMSEDFFWGCWK